MKVRRTLPRVVNDDQADAEQRERAEDQQAPAGSLLRARTGRRSPGEPRRAARPAVDAPAHVVVDAADVAALATLAVTTTRRSTFSRRM
jgi:hypothetical protein